MDFSDEYKDYLREVIIILKENITMLKQKEAVAKGEEKEYISGRLSSYNDMIAALKTTLHEHGIPEKEIGLDQIEI